MDRDIDHNPNGDEHNLEFVNTMFKYYPISSHFKAPPQLTKNLSKRPFSINSIGNSPLIISYY